MRSGDLVFARIGATTGKSYLFTEGPGAVFASYLIRVRPRNVDAQFLYFFCQTPHYWNQVERIKDEKLKGGINGSALAGLRHCLPPPHEQRAIAAVLTQVQASIVTQERLIQILTCLKSATLARLFTGGLNGGISTTTPYGEVPASWQTKTLDECAVVQTGLAKGKKISGPVVERPYLRVANVQDGYLDLSEIKSIELPEKEVQRYLLRDGDVLLTEGGDFDKLGRGYVWRSQIEGCVHQNHIFAVRTNRDVLLPDFFAHQIQSPYGKAYFLNVAHKTTNLACINSAKLKEFPVLAPPLEEQSRISSAIHGIDAAINAAVTKRDRLQLLFEESLTAFMSGSVRVTPLLNG